jgi:hypothetical protein
MGNSEIACGVSQEEFCCMDLPVSSSSLIYATAQDTLSLEVLT